MKTINFTNTCFTIAICFILAITFCTEIAAQRDIKKKTPTKKTTEATPKETPSAMKKETPPIDPDDRKKIIVVLDFDDVTLGNQKMQIGRQLAILLANEFSKNGAYTVIERQRLGQILKEQDLTFDDRFDPVTAAKVGKALAANPVVLGTITEYTVRRKVYGFGGMGKVEFSAKLGLAIRLVDVNTGVILNSVTVEEKATESGYKFGGGGTETDITEDLKTTLFTKAANKSVASAVNKLNPIINNQNGDVKPEVKATSQNQTTRSMPTSQSVSTAQTRTVAIPKVATIVGTTVYISGLGKDVKIGDHFSILRGIEIKDPDTGEVIDFDGKEIAKVEVTEVRANTVKAKIIKGADVREKDFVQPIK